MTDKKKIEIYSSTAYIPSQEEKVGMLQLEVVSMWDFKTPVIAYETIYGGKPNQRDIGLALKRCTEVVEPKWTKWETLQPEDITEDMVEELENMGLCVSHKVLKESQ